MTVQKYDREDLAQLAHRVASRKLGVTGRGMRVGIQSANEAECDCCGVYAVLTRCRVSGTETFACDDCREDVR